MNIDEFIKHSLNLEYKTFNLFKDKLEIFVENKIKNQKKRDEYLDQLKSIIIEQTVTYSSYPGVNDNEALENNREAMEEGLRKGTEEMIRFLLKLKSFLNSDLNDEKKSKSKDNLLVNIHPDIYSHIERLFNDGHYASAVEESYKITRQKLFQLTGKEKVHEAFSDGNLIKLFGKEPLNDAEGDFQDGVKFLHMSIQRFRNHKSHTPAGKLDKDRAIHYIYLSSLAMYLISN